MLSASTRSVIIHSVITQWTLTLVLDEQPICWEPLPRVSRSPRHKRRRVGNGASQARMHVHARKRSAVPTLLHIQADAKDRVGTAHDRLCDIGYTVPAPLPTLPESGCHDTSRISERDADLSRQLFVLHDLVTFAGASFQS